jgi:hypothetical protein
MIDRLKCRYLLKQDANATRHRACHRRRGHGRRKHNLDNNDRDDHVEQQERSDAEQAATVHGVVGRASGSREPAA